MTEIPAAQSPTDSKLDAVLGALASIADRLAGAPAAPAAAPAAGPVSYAGPAGTASMSAPVPPPPVAEPPKPSAAPFAGETMAPGDLAFYPYQDYRDPEGVHRVQVVSVAHVTDNHVHGIVLGDARNLAQFAPGQLTRAFPG